MRQSAEDRLRGQGEKIEKLENRCRSYDLTCSAQVLQIEALQLELAHVRALLNVKFSSAPDGIDDRTSTAAEREDWPEDADYALGHLVGLAFGSAPSDELGHCVELISAAIAPASSGTPDAANPR